MNDIIIIIMTVLFNYFELFVLRLKGDNLFEETKPVLDKNVIDVKGLKPGELYEFVVVAVDGNTMRESDVAEIEASSSGTYFSNLLDRIYCRHSVLFI